MVLWEELFVCCLQEGQLWWVCGWGPLGGARRRSCRGGAKVLWEELFVCCLWEGQFWWVPGCESWFGGERAAGSKYVVVDVGDWSGG